MEMRFSAKLIATIGVLLSFSAQANAASDWILLASTDTMVWEGRAGTLHLSKNNSQQDISVANGRATDTKYKRITFERWYVLVSACRNGSGKLVTTDMDGTFKFDTEFVLKGGSVASSLADMLCGFYTDAEGKGLSS
ncbi:hypothetical protein [Sphingomonas sp. UYEF23]|uniref:hypothetical protein n=1 Tax=Sphingomonas sp. UYEF23 TaxID=1756408 RepID=UPI00339740F2